MWSMWDAPSDRDYYEQFSPAEPEEDWGDRCMNCGATGDEACEEWCLSEQHTEGAD